MAKKLLVVLLILCTGGFTDAANYLWDGEADDSPFEVYQWAYANQWKVFDYNRSVVANTMAPDESLNMFWQSQHIRDYVIARRGFVFELSADPQREREHQLKPSFPCIQTAREHEVQRLSYLCANRPRQVHVKQI